MWVPALHCDPTKRGSDQCVLLGSTCQPLLLAAVLEEALCQPWVLQGRFQVLLLGSPPKTWLLVQPGTGAGARRG